MHSPLFLGNSLLIQSQLFQLHFTDEMSQKMRGTDASLMLFFFPLKANTKHGKAACQAFIVHMRLIKGSLRDLIGFVCVSSVSISPADD